MESHSRPPHRRKLSSATNGFSSSSSFKNPYDDVSLSKGGSTKKSFGAQEYAEIFSGSSSIPVLDLSGLEERVGLGDFRSSAKVDYSNIFGGLRNDDVAVPYEELFNASANTTKQRYSADASPPLQKSGPLPSSGRTKRSSAEASDQSTNGAKQQFNLSFNKTTQNNNDPSNGKTHITELDAVPGFTYFVDGTTQPHKKTGDGKPVQSLKRDVSRTWSFSAEVEAVKGKGGLDWDKIHTPEKLRNVNEFNLKSKPSKAPPVQSKVSTFASAKDTSAKDASGKIDGENSPPLLDEELDENSIAAVSAAALKKAIEQAQESIRIAKLIMEQKREGLQFGTKPRSKSGLKVKDKKKTRVDREVAKHPEEEISSQNRERSNPIFTGVDGEFVPSLSQSDPLINVEKAEVTRVMENIEIEKEHGEEFLGLDKKVELEKQVENVESVEASKEALNYPGSVSNTESRDQNLMSRLVGNISVMLFGNKPASSAQEMETGKGNAEDIETTIHHEKGPTGSEKQEMRSVTGDSGQTQATFDNSEGPENVNGVVARDLDTSIIAEDQTKIVEEEGERLRTGQKDQVIEDNERFTDDKEERGNNFVQNEEIFNGAEIMVLGSEIHNLMNGSEVEKEEIKNNTEYVDECKGNDMEVEKEEIKNNTEYVDECKGNDMEETTTRQIETHQYFESDARMKEGMEEEVINKRKSEIVPEIEEVEKKDSHANESEIDEEQSHVNDGDMQNSPGEFEQMEEKNINTFEYEVVETIEMGADNGAEVEYSDVVWDAEKMNNSPGEEERSEENQDKREFEEAVYDKDIDEAVDASSSYASTISSETKESCELDLNDRTEEYQKAFTSYKENVSVTEVSETFNGIDEDKDAGTEENIVRKELQNTDEGLSNFDGNADNEQLPRSDGETHDAGYDCAAEIQNQTLPDFEPAENKTAEFDLSYIQPVFEQASVSDVESVSTSSVDINDGLSAHEYQEGEVLNIKTSNEVEIRDDTEMTSNERKHVEVQRDAVHSESDSEIKDMETERDTVTGQNTEKNKENPSKVQKKDTKENVQNFDKNEHQQRIEAIKKGREREKDRMAVERAMREARERAFAEARERAERDAVERAAAEARQRAMAEAREKLDKSSNEAKIRADRAAVERATAEARERALEKAKTQIDRSIPEKPTSSSRNNALKHSFSSSDIEAVEGTSTESAQRRKARLERHQRIMERAAKALAEKNMRDLVAQKEQAERNRLAESLDAEIKRWAAGKEGNLRALLSTLQYILGSSSGWQPISLTEIITTPAVKKAYRKATLYVHPDKLQQRGASIQQKYICEKVFDLLKAAWNRFNSEER